MQCTYCVHIVLKNTFAVIEVGYGLVRGRFGGMGKLKGGLRCKVWVNSVIINVRFHFILMVPLTHSVVTLHIHIY